MMLKKISIAIVALISAVNLSVLAQEKELIVNYTYEEVYLDNDENKDNKYEIKGISNNKVRSYTFGHLSIREINPAVVFAGNFSNIIDTIYSYVTVDYTKGELMLPVGDHRNPKLLKEPLGLFDWEMCEGEKEILGYKCTKVTCTFRGRDYVAYFTRQLPFKAAPWKFHGLPGVVLEVRSKDEMNSWTAQSLFVRDHKTDIDTDYWGMETINMEQYMKMLNKPTNKSIVHKVEFITDDFMDRQRKRSKLMRLEIFDPEINPETQIKK